MVPHGEGLVKTLNSSNPEDQIHHIVNVFDTVGNGFKNIPALSNSDNIIKLPVRAQGL